MRTPFEKLKKADKELKAVMVISLVVGLFIIADVLYLYLNHILSNLWDRQLSAAVYKPIIKGSLVGICIVLPALGVLLILVAFKIWDYRRKREIIKEHDKSDA